ncbi:MAG: hypothetical protein HC895_04660 [Leptolyngbyaceae cyanobacterium SM1_3_5]|nr:hypothetical protein [Leptolyngbyaceae cyanobacterium SM1_3_5]
MSRFTPFAALATGIAVAIALPTAIYAQSTHTGTVERVWEDGFRLNTGDRTLTVDSWDVYGDNTPRHVSVGDRVTITGEFEDGEFDAFSIVDAPRSSQ